MADSGAFSFVCERLEEATSLDRLEARGTVRIALKQAGLESRSVTPEQMGVVLDRILPGELASRGIDRGDDVCRNVSALLAATPIQTGDAPDRVFARLGHD